MTDEIKILLALQQIDNVMELVKGNNWEIFFSRQLIPAHYELKRQLTNLSHSSTIKK